jgi:hypothetical protein
LTNKEEGTNKQYDGRGKRKKRVMIMQFPSYADASMQTYIHAGKAGAERLRKPKRQLRKCFQRDDLFLFWTPM